MLLSGGYYLLHDRYARPGLAAVVLLVAAVWTGVVSVLLADPARRTAALLAVDLGLACGLLLAGLAVQSRHEVHDLGQPSLTLSWGALPVVAWAVRSGPVAGGLAAAAVCAATVLWRGELTRPTVGSCVLLLLTGVTVGYVVMLARQAERAYAELTAREAAQAERERLTRHVHDGALQTLALVARQAGDPVLVQLARQSETELRRLLAGPARLAAGTLDLVALLPAGADVELVAPAVPVALPAAAATELTAAVAACVDNVRRHAGGTAWLLVEDEPAAVTVTVRDAGPGIAEGRLDQARYEGRLGIARSVRGRLDDLGGSMRVVSEPGQGTEVELRVPR